MTGKPIEPHIIKAAIDMHLAGATKIAACEAHGIKEVDTLTKYMRRLRIESPKTDHNKAHTDALKKIIEAHLKPVINPMQRPLKILIMDTEVLPNQGYFYERFSDYGIPQQFIDKPKALCAIGYKWLGDEKVTVLAADTPYEDKLILQQFAPVVEQADYMVGHNIKAFDIKVLNGRMYHNKLSPLSPVNLVDTLTLARQRWGQVLNGNSLDHIAEMAGLGRKIKIDASLWVRCAQGDKEAMQEMIIYNEQDVNLLEKVLVGMLPHVNHKINHNLHVDSTVRLCNTCGSDDLEHKGFEYTASTIRERKQCRCCTAWSPNIRKKK